MLTMVSNEHKWRDKKYIGLYVVDFLYDSKTYFLRKSHRLR